MSLPYITAARCKAIPPLAEGRNGPYAASDLSAPAGQPLSWSTINT